jgi:hypothetical protein
LNKGESAEGDQDEGQDGQGTSGLSLGLNRFRDVGRHKK